MTLLRSHGAVAVVLALGGVACRHSVPVAPESGHSVTIDFTAQNANGQRIVDMKQEDIVVKCDGSRLRVTSLAALGAPGQYRVTFMPKSDQGGATGRTHKVFVSTRRKGVRISARGSGA
jgi:hypothetical protein